MDEFFESMTLIQTGKTEPFPVILIGREFWSPLLDWMRTNLLGRHGYVANADLDLCESGAAPCDRLYEGRDLSASDCTSSSDYLPCDSVLQA